jgi:GNAT superfamily N-acetyltransferase
LDELEYRELMDDKDAFGYLKLHNTTFPSVSFEFWQNWIRAEDITISLALKNGEVVGAVPFQLRDFYVRPDANIKAAFEFSVVVREDLRGKGIGSGTMNKAKEFLKGRCDVMMVYRGGERTPAYNFYYKNGHYDIAYLRLRILREPRKYLVSKVKISDIDILYNREGEVLQVFSSAFGMFGGYPKRHMGYYRKAFNTIQFQEEKLNLKFLYIEEKDSLTGYAIVGKKNEKPEYIILEMATKKGDEEIAFLLVKGISNLAADSKCTVTTYTPDFSLYSRILRRTGFKEIPRSSHSLMIMAHLVDPNSLAKKVWRYNEKLRQVEVYAWSPKREVILHEASPFCRRKIILEMKEDTLTRLLLSRLDLVSAVKQEFVTVVEGGMKEIKEIAKSLPCASWEHQQIDYI